MIIVVDDYPDTAEVLCVILRMRKVPARCAHSGHEVLSLIRAYPADQPLLVVLDDMMPDMSGIDTLKAIRLDPKIANTTVIMHSAGFDLDHRDQAMALGAVAWLLKGGGRECSLDNVLECIVQWYRTVGGVHSG